LINQKVNKQENQEQWKRWGEKREMPSEAGVKKIYAKNEG